MKLAIFTLVEHIEKDGALYGYAPYIREMDLWCQHVDEVIVVAPKSISNSITAIDLPYKHPKVKLVEVPNFNVKSLFSILRILALMPSVLLKMYKVMRAADQFHFRCPSNVAAIAALVQILFPSKKKITKYAGNWDPKSNQPRGYRFQKWLLGNTVLTKKMRILVYGVWQNQSPYVTPFISATYFDTEKVPYLRKDYTQTLQFVFTGALVVGKRPLLTIKTIELLNEKGVAAQLQMFGEGIMRSELEAYVVENNLEQCITLQGNQEKELVREALKKAHFTILPSKSEGWPKAVAEGMFFGSIPVSTKISCLEWMLNYGQRGILIEPDVNAAVQEIERHLRDVDLDTMAKAALYWSRQYTQETLKAAIAQNMLD